MARARTLASLRAVQPDVERIKAAQDFIADREREIKEARRVRNEAVRSMVAEFGPAETARRTGMPLPTVKAIKGVD
jgi:hypothetical protein